MKTLTAALLLSALVFSPCPAHAAPDWLLNASPFPAAISTSSNGREVSLSNGLIRRTWRLQPNLAAVAFDNLMLDTPVLRAVRPEARVSINGESFDIGGLNGQPDQAYLRTEWIDSLSANPAAFQYTGIETGTPQAPFGWARVRAGSSAPWPPAGAAVNFHFAPPAGKLPGIRLSVHYELYDGIPVISKWIEIENTAAAPVHLDTFTSEILAAVEYESAVDSRERWEFPNLHVESDFGYGGMDPFTARRTIYWQPDPLFTTQVNYNLQSPVLLECRLPVGPDIDIAPGETFKSFRTYELVYDSTERERKGLALRRMYRTIAPWITENPIMLHIRNAEPGAVRLALDQCAEVGAEMAILSFGSGFDMENEDPAYIAQMKELVDYAHSKGVQLGGYSLLASRHISEEDDVLNPATGKPGGATFGHSPCLGSPWGQDYFHKIKSFIEQTGLDLLEHDGSYPGDLCASTSHPGHKGLNDSLWTQYRTIADFYHWCRERGVFLNVPDWYMLSGSNKTGMGYREVNWSLPQERQWILGRQNIFDGTWQKTPSMGWMFVPLVEYQGGGAAATIEPLSEHLPAYGAHLAQNFGAGVQACYRGPRWYDTDETKALVQQWIGFFKQYRVILESDIIHVRRPDGRDLDCILHVNPNTYPRGLAMVYNPLDTPREKTFNLPLYYTGLRDTARIREQDGEVREVALDQDYNVEVTVNIPAKGNTWIVVE